MRFLTDEHKEYLKSRETLFEWIGLSLKERCIRFHRRFGLHRINPTLLSKFYKINKIKMKKIKMVKIIDPNKE